MTSFSGLMAQLAAAPDGSRLEVSEDWTQGRTLFGGLTAAFCVARGEILAAEGQDGALPPLRSGQFAFVGPAFGALKLSGEVLRRGKSTVFVQVDLVGEAGLATRALLTFGAGRPSTIDDEDLPAPASPVPDAAPALHGSGGPSFVRHFDIRSADGIPLRPSDPSAPRPVLRPDLLLWARHRDEAAGLGPAALLALADIPPPAAMRLMTQPGPISTMTWMVDLMSPPPLPDDAGWRLLRSTAQVTRSGYSSQSMSLWDHAGRPLVIGRQNVAVFS